MSLYLQRLLDRGAANMLDAPTARPMVVSNSPVLRFDQRLAQPDFAGEFSLLGAPPEAHDAPDPARADDIATLVKQPSSASPANPPAPAPPDAPFRTDIGSLPAMAWVRAATPLPDLAVEPSPAPLGALGEPASSPVRADTSRSASVPAPAPASLPVGSPTGATTQSAARVPPPALPAGEHAVAPPIAGAASGKEARSVADLAVPAPPRPAEAFDAPASPPRPAAPAIDALPIVGQAAPAASPKRPAFGEPGARFAAEPVVVEPQPLPAAPTPLGEADVVRIVHQAMKAERASDAQASAPRPRQPAESEANVPAAQETPRPATAAEASVIGRLESSRYRPMLFGVRRR